MKETDDHILDAFQNKSDEQKMKDYVTAMQQRINKMKLYSIKEK